MIPASSAFQSELNSTDRIIRAKVEIYDTAMAVKSKGCPFELYQWTSGGEPSWAGGDRILPSISGNEYCVIPNISLYWGYSSPFYMNLSKWGIQFFKFFYAEQSGTVKFYMFGDSCKVKMLWGAGETQILAATDLIHNGAVVGTSGQSVVSGTWYQFKIRVWGETGHRLGGFVVHYTYDTETPTQTTWRSFNLTPLNAGVVSHTNSFLSPITVAGVGKIRGTRAENEPSQYEFTLPYGDETGAYKKSGSVYTNGTADLKEGKLIKIFAGYDCDTTPVASQTIGDVSGNIEYLPRFTGYIEGFELDRNNNELTVKCRDFMTRLENSLCLNYPDPASYWSFRYVINTNETQPDGYNVPMAYDKWGVTDAMKDLLMKAGIPFSLFKGTIVRRESDGDLNLNTGDAIFDNEYRLDQARFYGTDQVEEYVHKFDIGTTIHEALMKLVDTYGYRCGFRYDSYFTLEQTNNATLKQDSGQGSGSGTQIRHTSALGGFYHNLENTNDTRTYSFQGTGVTVIMRRGPDAGIDNNDNQYWSGTAGVTFTLKNSGSQTVGTWNYNMYLSEEWFYTNGIFPMLGANPCIIPLTQNLNYDTYTLEIKNLNGIYNIDIDEVWIYNFTYSEIMQILQTYKSGGNIASIKDLRFERGVQDQRNDILVVGQRKGIHVPTGNKEVGLDDPEFSKHLNNQYINYHSRSVDVDSIYNPNAENYVGRHLMTYIQEPNINTYQRADWLSFNILRSYRNIENSVDFSVIGNSILEVGDCISILDKVEEGGTNKWWIKSINEEITSDNWDIKADIFGKDPYPSYERNSEYDISLYNNNFLAEIEIVDSYGYNRDGRYSGYTLYGRHASSAITLNLKGTNASGLPSAGVMVIYSPNNAYYGIFKYTSSMNSPPSITGEFVFVMPVVSGGTSFEDGCIVRNIYNPYEQGDSGVFMKIRFRCLVNGEIAIGVKKTSGDVLGYIAGVSAGGGLDNNGMPEREEVTAGEEKEWTWGGIDQTGKTHDPETSEIGANFFAEDGHYYFQIHYINRDTGEEQIFSTAHYVDENNTAQSKIIHLLKTGIVDPIMTANWGSRNTEKEYLPDNNGAYQLSRCKDYYNKNWVWLRKDGDIDIDLKSYKYNVYRAYHITAEVIGYEAKIAVDQPNVHSSLNIEHVENIEIATDNIISFSNTNSYNFPFNPIYLRFGGFDFDAKFENDWLTIQNDFLGRIYWIRLLLDIRDMSGRKVQIRDIHGSIPNLYALYGTRGIYNDNKMGVLEIMWIPNKIDKDEPDYYKEPYIEWIRKGGLPSFEDQYATPDVCWLYYSKWW